MNDSPVVKKMEVVINEEFTAKGYESISGDKETKTLRPRFIVFFEMLPSGLSTILLLLLIYGISIFCLNNYSEELLKYSIESDFLLYLTIFLFVLKYLKVLLRQIKYRNVYYNITDLGVEYIKEDRNYSSFFIGYEEMTEVKIQRNLLTYVFGYGHILIKSGNVGIYLDYVASVEEVYDYILQNVKRS